MNWQGPWARRFVTAAIIVAGMVALGSSASADQGSVADQITQTYQNATLSWQTSLMAHAKALFALLAGIEVVFSMCRLVVRGGELNDWIYELFQQIMYIGFFGWLLTNYGTFTGYIIQSFEQAGATASQSAGGAGGLTPGDTFSAGLQVFTAITKIPPPQGLLNAAMAIPNALALVILAIVTLVCFVLIACEQILTLVESYIVVAAGMLMMGFGGSRWTKDQAIKTFGYSLNVGAKLMILNLIVGLGLTLMKQWASTITTSSNITNVVVILGQAVIMLALTKSVPQMVQGLVHGSTGHSSGAVERAAGQIAAAVGGAVATAVGAGMAANAASSLASEQLKNSDDNGGGPKSGLGQMLGHIGKTAQNLGQGVSEDIGNKLSGKPGSNSGVMGGRIAANLGMQAQALQDAAKKPDPPGDESTEPDGEADTGSGSLSGDIAAGGEQEGRAEDGAVAQDGAGAAATASGGEAVIDGGVQETEVRAGTAGLGAGLAMARAGATGGAATVAGASVAGASVAGSGEGSGGGATSAPDATAASAVAAGEAAAVGSALIDAGVKGAGWTGADGPGADADADGEAGQAIPGFDVGSFGASGRNASPQASRALSGAAPQPVGQGPSAPSNGNVAVRGGGADGGEAGASSAAGFRAADGGLTGLALDGVGQGHGGGDVVRSAASDTGEIAGADVGGSGGVVFASASSSPPVADATASSLADDRRTDAASLASDSAGSSTGAARSSTGSTPAGISSASPSGASAGSGRSSTASPPSSSAVPSAAGPASSGAVVSSGAPGPAAFGSGLGGSLSAPSSAMPITGASTSQPLNMPAPSVSPPLSGQVASRVAPTTKGSS